MRPALTAVIVIGSAVVLPHQRAAAVPVITPRATFRQTPTELVVTLENLNAHWELADQPIGGLVFDEDGTILGGFAADAPDWHHPADRCCVITLRPRGKTTFRLRPVIGTVWDIHFEMRGGDGWRYVD